MIFENMLYKVAEIFKRFRHLSKAMIINANYSPQS